MKLAQLRRSPWSIPTLLGVGSLFALITALAADGIWDALSWLLLFLPIAVIAAAIFSKASREKSGEG